MPYDPRPVSKGGNRGFGESFGSTSEEGNYRVIGVDTFDGTDWVEGDFPTKKKALKVAEEKGGEMTKMYVYGSNGEYITDFGTF